MLLLFLCNLLAAPASCHCSSPPGSERWCSWVKLGLRFGLDRIHRQLQRVQLLRCSLVLPPFLLLVWLLRFHLARQAGSAQSRASTYCASATHPWWLRHLQPLDVGSVLPHNDDVSLGDLADTPWSILTTLHPYSDGSGSQVRFLDLMRFQLRKLVWTQVQHGTWGEHKHLNISL